MSAIPVYEDEETVPIKSGESIELSWKSLTYDVMVRPSMFKFRQRKRVLDDITGIARPGRLLAIMGSSGAGKSSLLDLLARRSKSGTVTGSLLVNGEKPTQTFYRNAAYVTQEDVLMGSLTVTETLRFYANLKLPETLGFREKEGRVRRIIHDLGLAHVAKSTIGTPFRRGISGGEKKRVSIGVEMITDPQLLFLDEPTTGLDAYNSLAVVEHLHKLAKQGRTVVCTIHQPRSSIFDLFDDVCVLDGGQVVYFGSGDGLEGYFRSRGFEMQRHANPADYVLDIVVANKDYRLVTAEQRSMARSFKRVGRDVDVRASLRSTDDGDAEEVDLVGTYNDSDEARSVRDAVGRVHSAAEADRGASSVMRGVVGGVTDSLLGRKYATTLVFQSLVLLLRNLVNTIRTPTVTYVMAMSTIFMAALVSSLYWRQDTDQAGVQNRTGALFFILINSAFSQFQSLALFMQERDIFKRERASGTYRTTAYFLSKVAVDLPMSMLWPALSGTVVYWLIGFQPDVERFFIFLLTIVLFAGVAGSINAAIGSLAPNLVVAQIFAPIITVVFLLVSGFYAQLDSIPIVLRPLSFISYIRYAFGIMLKNEFEGLTFSCERPPACIFTGEQELELLGFDDVDIWLNIAILAAMLVVYRIIAYVFLLLLHREKR